ncbi:hypothetical protein RCL1_004078 [Eukaryota sp. TZLM3-RCL]
MDTDTSAQPDSYLLKVRTLIKKRRKLFFALGVLTACSILLPIIAYLLFVPHQVLAFHMEMPDPEFPGGFWKLTLDLKRKTERFEGHFFGVMFRYLLVGNQVHQIGPDICSSLTATQQDVIDFSSVLTFNRHLYTRGEVRKVTAGKCRYYYNDEDGLCMSKGFILQKCDRSKEDGKIVEECYDMINHRKLKKNDELLDVSKACPRMQKGLYETKIRNENSEKWEVEVVDRMSQTFFKQREEPQYFFNSLVKNGYLYTRKEPTGYRTCDLDRSKGFSIENDFDNFFIDGRSEKKEYDADLDCDVYLKPGSDYLVESSSCIDKNGYVKKFVLKGNRAGTWFYKDHKEVEKNDERFDVAYTCDMPTASKTVPKLFKRL